MTSVARDILFLHFRVVMWGKEWLAKVIWWSLTTLLPSPFAKSRTWLYQFILPPTTSESLVALHQGLANLFCEGRDQKYLSLGKLHGLSHNSPTLLLLRNSNHQPYINERTWPCSRKPLLGDAEIWISTNLCVSQNTVFFWFFFQPF